MIKGDMEIFKDPEPETIELKETEEKEAEKNLLKIKLNGCTIQVIEVNKTRYLKIFKKVSKCSIYIKMTSFNSLLSILKDKNFI